MPPPWRYEPRRVARLDAVTASGETSDYSVIGYADPQSLTLDERAQCGFRFVSLPPSDRADYYVSSDTRH